MQESFDRDYATGAPAMDETPFGEFLRQERETRQVSIEEMSSATKIKPELLMALEDSDINALPPETFVKGFIKSYAGYLELSPDEALGRYLAEARRRQAPVHGKAKKPIQLSLRMSGWIDSLKRLLTGREDYQVF